MIKGKKFLITGGTGSLGKSLTKKLLASGADTVRILSRNESKQIEMENEIMIVWDFLLATLGMKQDYNLRLKM